MYIFTEYKTKEIQIIHYFLTIILIIFLIDLIHSYLLSQIFDIKDDMKI